MGIPPSPRAPIVVPQGVLLTSSLLFSAHKTRQSGGRGINKRESQKRGDQGHRLGSKVAVNEEVVL